MGVDWNSDSRRLVFAFAPYVRGFRQSMSLLRSGGELVRRLGRGDRDVILGLTDMSMRKTGLS